MKLLALALAAFCVPSLAQTTLYVDPVNGADVPGAGTAAMPFRTITEAVKAPVSGHLVLKLYPGQYTKSGGEQYPIQLPDSVEVSGVYPCGAVLRFDISLEDPFPTTVFRMNGTSGELLNGVFRDFRFNTAHRGVQVIAGGPVSAYLSMENLEGVGFRVLAVSAQKNFNASIRFDDCRLQSIENVLKLTAKSNSNVSVSATRSSFRGGTLSGLLSLEPEGQGASVIATARNTVFRKAGVGIRAAPSGNAQVRTVVENCVFFDLGAITVPPNDFSGGIVDAIGAHQTAPVHEVSNSIFWGNQYGNDLPQFKAASYTLTSNLFENAGLAAMGGSTTGDPMFFDAEGGDFHLLAGSPAIDAGTNLASPNPTDVDGDDRIDTLFGAGRVDLGVDEYYDRHVRFTPKPRLGKTTRMTLLGPPGSLAFVLMGSATTGAPFGSGVLLADVYSPTPIATATISASGVHAQAFPLPAAAALQGVPYAIQGGFLEAPGVASVTYNAYEGELCQ